VKLGFSRLSLFDEEKGVLLDVHVNIEQYVCYSH
jgi:hypothetical protein